MHLSGDRARTDPFLVGEYTLSSTSTAFEPFESTLSSTAVPEPATLVLLAGAVALVGTRRRTARQ